MSHSSTSDLYAAHAARLSAELSELLATHQYDGLLVHAGAELPVSRFDDRFWTFNPTPAFAHISPIEEPGAAILVRDGELSIHRPTHDTYWDAPPPPPPEWALSPFAELAPQPLAGRVAFIGEDPSAAESWGVRDDDINPAKLLADIDAIRAIKSAYEVECVAAANRIAARGHVALADAFASSDSSELALHLHYLAITDQDDVDTPYKGIVAIGRNAAVLHHNRYGKSPTGAAGCSMLVDAGAQVRGYAADVTRTHVKTDIGLAGGQRFAEWIAALDKLQQTICARVEPGLSFEVLHDQTHELLAGVVRDLELSSASEEELIAAGVTRALFPHGLGHSLGIQVHDVGCKIKPPAERNPALRNTADIAVGHVFTVEPGCYFIDTLLDPLRSAPIGAQIDWKLLDLLHPYGGIRIEDNLAVLEAETRNLTRDNWPSPP